MIRLRFQPDIAPEYMTRASSGADVRSAEDLVIAPGARARVATGMWIDGVNWEKVPQGMVPELQIRARSGLAFKHGITLTNGVGTIDADYPDEIGILLWNTGSKEFVIKRGDRIAQLVLAYVPRLEDLSIGGERTGGFGSTKV